MEELLQNILDINVTYDKINRKEILIIGDFKDYRDRMSKNFIRFLDYLRDYLIDYKIIYYGTGIPEFIKGISLLQIIKKLCHTLDPIIWICDVRGPTMISRIYEYNGIKIYDYEDVMGKRECVIKGINEGGFDYVFYKNDGSENNKIKLECPGIKFMRYDHYIDENKFKDYKLDKEYDILCFGCINYGCYPFRKRLFKILSENKDIKTYGDPKSSIKITIFKPFEKHDYPLYREYRKNIETPCPTCFQSDGRIWQLRGLGKKYKNKTKGMRR